jgi:hypothetical protein
MSYDICYKDKEGRYFELDLAHEEGGTYPIGGTKNTQLNVTYNYSWYYYLFLDKSKGIRWLYGRKGKDCINRLEKAIKEFKDKPLHKDYWADTPGNCVKPLKIFLEWCNKFPEGIFSGD